MATIGQRAELNVIRFVDFGLYLDAGKLGEVLLPRKYVPEGAREGDRLTVFLYHDSEGRPVATTEEPYAEVGEFAALRVISVTKDGAFLDWGVTRALFVPFREQKRRFREGEWVVVYLYIDEQTGRAVGSSRLNRFLNCSADLFQEGELVDLLLYDQTELGFKAVINQRADGLLYHSEQIVPLRIGDEIEGYIAKIREDGKIDLALQLPGHEKVLHFAEELLRAVQEAGGVLPYGDSSSPEEIRERFGVSKKTFKKAAGALFKERKVVIYPYQILLQ